jgi:predicted ester cyclase
VKCEAFSTNTVISHQGLIGHHMQLEDVVAEADKVWFRGTRSGTQQGKGPLPGLAPTGKFAAVQHMHVFRIANGKIVEHWAVRADLSFLQQVGLFPGPGQAS